MSKDKKSDYTALYPGISDEIVAFLKKSDRKMEYQQYDIKCERFVVDQEHQTVMFVPSREDSIQRLAENNTQFEDKQLCVEDLVVHCMMLEKMRHCLELLTKDERKLIYSLSFMAE